MTKIGSSGRQDLPVGRKPPDGSRPGSTFKAPTANARQRNHLLASDLPEGLDAALVQSLAEVGPEDPERDRKMLQLFLVHVLKKNLVKLELGASEVEGLSAKVLDEMLGDPELKVELGKALERMKALGQR